MQKEEKEGGEKGEAGGWLQKNGVELSISPEETSSHFTIVPFPSRVRQGLKSACYSGPSHPPILPSNIKRMFRYLGVDRSSALFKFFIQNFGKLGGEGDRALFLLSLERRETRSSKTYRYRCYCHYCYRVIISAITGRRNDRHATL